MPLDEATKQRLRRVRTDCRVLLDLFADRLTEQQRDTLTELGAAGEWTALADALSAYLVRVPIPVTPAERDAVAGVLAQFTSSDQHYTYVGDPEGTVAALTVTTEEP